MILGSLVASAALAGCPASSPAPAPAAPSGATSGGLGPAARSSGALGGKRVVVLLVVDQLPSWTFSRDRPAFHAGFARLLREGVYWPRAAYPYAPTVTAVGHTTLATGAPPRVSGIVENAWYDRAARRWIDPTEDAAHPTVPPLPGNAKDDGASPHFELADTAGVGDRVLSISFKERAAILMAGRRAPSDPRPDDVTAAWFEPRANAFVTSTYYATTEPTWLSRLARERPIAPRLAGYVWTPLAGTPSRAPAKDDEPGEVGTSGLGTTFPHALAAATDPSHAVAVTPLANELVLEAVIEALDAGERPDLLCVSFSAHDLAAHAWGQESWEATDVLLRLDDVVGRLLDALDARYGKDGWSMVFSSDHGGPPLVERAAKDPATEARRVDVADVRSVAERAAAAAVGEGAWIAAADDHMLYLSDAARALPDAERNKLLDAIVEAARAVPGMGFALRIDRAPFATGADCTGLGELETLVCRSVFPGRSGEVYWGPRRYSALQHRPFAAVNHGTPWDYDREVPIVVREPGRSPRVAEGEVPSTLRVAPTLARMLGKPAPPTAREPSL